MFILVLWGTITTLSIISHMKNLIVKKEIVTEEYIKTTHISKIGKDFVENINSKIGIFSDEAKILNEYLNSKSIENKNGQLSRIAELKKINEKIKISLAKDFLNLDEFRNCAKNFLNISDQYLELASIIILEHNYTYLENLNLLEEDIIKQQNEIFKVIKTLEVA
ncbi:MAG: hypothetical protein ACRC41_14725 [Sarcina sp.]